MVAVSSIQSRDWSPKLGSYGEVVENADDIAQCLQIVCGTRKGEVVFRPEFGCDMWQWLDAPIALAQANIPRVIIEALTFWEPRVKVNSISVLPQTGNTAGLVVDVNWSVNGSAAIVTTTVASTASSSVSTSAAQQISDAVVSAALNPDIPVPDFEIIYETAAT